MTGDGVITCADSLLAARVPVNFDREGVGQVIQVRDEGFILGCLQRQFVREICEPCIGL